MPIRTSFDRKARTAALRKVADDLDMEFSEKDEWGMRALLMDFELFQKGHRKRIRNLMSKSKGLLDEQHSIFDYQYTISTGKSSRTFYQTVFFLQSKNLGLPEMLIYPENFFHKIGSFFGMQDIDFLEWPEFSKKFLLQGEEHRIRQIMNEKITKFFLVEKHWCLESLGYYMILYRRNAMVTPKYLKTFYQKGMSLYEHLKEE